MAIIEFPAVDTADEHGLLAVGGDLEVSSLLLAYKSGIFPWPFDDSMLAWFSPPKRAVLSLNEFHISKSLLRESRRTNYKFAFNTAFPSVIKACAESKNGRGRKKSWITKEMLSSFINLFNAGFCYSVECLDQDELIGGVYGVCINGLVTAESMFYKRDNASKLSLLFLINYLKEKEVPWIDLQVINPFTRKLGAKEIPRSEYMKILKDVLDRQGKIFSKTASEEA